MTKIVVVSGSKKYILPARGNESIGDVLSRNGLLPLPCGGKGLCGLCKIRVLRGEVSELSGNERALGVKPPERLACKAKPLGDIEVEISPITVAKPVSRRSLNIIVKQREPVSSRLRELWTKSIIIGRDVVEKLINEYDAKDFDSILLVDLGTTKIAYQFIDRDGNILEEDIVLTPLLEYGLDIISRLSKAIEKPSVKDEMRQRLITTLTTLRDVNQVKLALVCGNTFMEYLFLGLPLEDLSHHPFKPSLKGPFMTHMGDTMVLTPPVLDGFVGGDAYADLVATIEMNLETPFLLIDIGTNTEVLLVTETDILVTSAPAGPAIEGQVERASYIGRGGVTKVKLIDIVNGKPVFSINYIETPRYFLGSGLISLVAELKRHGLIRRDGVFLTGYDIVNGTKSYTIDRETGLYFTQVDMRKLQEAFAAIKTAWKILLEEAKIREDSLKYVVVTGNMAIYVETEDLIETGIIPPINKHRVLSAGNLVLSGLRAMFLNSRYMVRYEDLLSKIRHIYLPMVPNYMEKWVKNLVLP